jgi:methylmalonyl-CoA/ethylmalonyl-CoA epimerase
MQGGNGGLNLPPLNHIGVVVRDMDEVGRSLKQVFGLELEDEFEYTARADDMLAGEPFTLRIAAAKIGGATYEFLQPVAGKSLWADFLESSGEGTHHVAFTVQDWAADVARIQEGGSVMVAGATVDKFDNKRWAYFDTHIGGLIVELMEDYGL